jgi:hypothetical protein
MSACLRRSLVVCLTPIVLYGCAVVAPADHRAAQAREALTQLEANPDVKTYAPDRLAQAEQAVSDAEGIQASAETAATAGYVAQIRVQIAGYAAQANRDRQAYEQLVARRDALRPGKSKDGLTTLALDALNAGTAQFEFKPIGSSASLPPPTEKPVTVPQKQSPSLPVEVIPQTAAASVDHDPHPLIALSDSAFSGGTGLKPAACEALNRVVPTLTKHVQRPVLVYFGTINATAMERASAVRDYLASRGVARQRLFIAATSDISIIPAGGISVDFQ